MDRSNATGSKCGPISGLLLAMLCGIAGGAPIEQFANPPDSARPWVYWFIMDGNLSREGITADLESMKAAGLGGVILMEVNVGIPRGPVEFMSEAWRALFKHAVEEAERLGLQITLNAGPGWTGSGGQLSYTFCRRKVPSSSGSAANRDGSAGAWRRARRGIGHRLLMATSRWISSLFPKRSTR